VKGTGLHGVQWCCLCRGGEPEQCVQGKPNLFSKNDQKASWTDPLRNEALQPIALKTILQELQKPNSHAGGIFSLILSFDAK
jgi:hypothetical protein